MGNLNSYKPSVQLLEERTLPDAGLSFAKLPIVNVAPLPPICQHPPVLSMIGEPSPMQPIQVSYDVPNVSRIPYQSIVPFIAAMQNDTRNDGALPGVRALVKDLNDSPLKRVPKPDALDEYRFENIVRRVKVLYLFQNDSPADLLFYPPGVGNEQRQGGVPPDPVKPNAPLPSPQLFPVPPQVPTPNTEPPQAVAPEDMTS
ncbi:MAG: hypothetical protein HOO67_02565 [Candidatus Peribacteraceae bacterium]|nr:hypothetical protein [Candidatus Peribacteraceae bacterium]